MALGAPRCLERAGAEELDLEAKAGGAGGHERADGGGGGEGGGGGGSGGGGGDTTQVAGVVAAAALARLSSAAVSLGAASESVQIDKRKARADRRTMQRVLDDSPCPAPWEDPNGVWSGAARGHRDGGEDTDSARVSGDDESPGLPLFSSFPYHHEAEDPNVANPGRRMESNRAPLTRTFSVL